MNATLAPPADSVTRNDSGQVASTVMHNDCSGCEQYERYGPPHNRRWGTGQLHCTNCHANSHIACLVCDSCLPDRHRYDRRYCSSTCRVTLHKRREEARLERLVWEEENPEEARQQEEKYQVNIAAMREALQGTGLARNPAHLKRERELKGRAERCAERTFHLATKTFTDCPARFELGDVIYRRKEYVKIVTDPVLPYCHEHRCSQRDGYHNRDAPEGQYYPSCKCDDEHWDKPAPCPGCTRLVCHPTRASWRRVRDWLYSAEKPRAEPRPFCSENCRRLVFRTEREATRQAERDHEVECAGCSANFKGRRRDARYCSVACRQRAYRQRHPALSEEAV